MSVFLAVHRHFGGHDYVVYMPHSGYDEVECIEAQESVRITLTEVGGDLNIELKLDIDDDEHRGLDSTVRTLLRIKKLRWFQLLQEFDCTVTSTWTNSEDTREFHTWRAWGSRVRKKQLDYVMGPKDIRSTTWYLNLGEVSHLGPFSCAHQDRRARY